MVARASGILCMYAVAFKKNRPYLGDSQIRLVIAWVVSHAVLLLAALDICKPLLLTEIMLKRLTHIAMAINLPELKRVQLVDRVLNRSPGRCCRQKKLGNANSFGLQPPLTLTIASSTRPRL